MSGDPMPSDWLIQLKLLNQLLATFLKWFSHMQNIGNVCISHFILAKFYKVDRILVAHIKHA